jgi:hypothetical protein
MLFEVKVQVKVHRNLQYQYLKLLHFCNTYSVPKFYQYLHAYRCTSVTDSSTAYLLQFKFPLTLWNVRFKGLEYQHTSHSEPHIKTLYRRPTAS